MIFYYNHELEKQGLLIDKTLQEFKSFEFFLGHCTFW